MPRPTTPAAIQYADLSVMRSSSVIAVADQLREQVESSGAEVLQRSIIEHWGRVTRTPVAWFHGYPHQVRDAALLVHRHRIAGLQVDAYCDPAPWRRACRDLHAVYAPSRWCLDILRPALPSGCEEMVVPHGIAPPVETRPQELRGRFTALLFTTFSSEWGHYLRKGVDVAIEGCRLAGVDLVIRAGELVEQHLGDRIDGDRVRLFDRLLSPQEMGECFQGAHVLLAPSRSEAFGMVPAEALSYGVPVVATGGTGMDEFLPDDARCVRIQTSGRRPLGTFGVPGGEVDDITPEAVAEALVEVQEGYDARRRLTEWSAAGWAEDHGWERAAAPLTR